MTEGCRAVWDVTKQLRGEGKNKDGINQPSELF